jgi:hypothetical protein
MSKFTFSLASTGSLIDRSVYSNTPDDQLTYTGDDSIVWDRVNSERVRRGLDSLTTLGFPRPPEETADVSTAGSSQEFTVEGPPGLTREQAFEIFQQQQKAGSLVGLKPGATISSLTQARDGVPGALAQLGQGLQLPDIGAGFGTNIAGIGDQLGSGLSSVGARLSNLTQNLPVTDGINIADFAKQIPAVKDIGNLDTTQVRAAAGQAAKLVSQGAAVLSDTKGLGKYGLDTTQLERAGYVKPGTAAAYLGQASNSVTSVLQSPAVWTGKNGVSGVTDLLASTPRQDLIQQDLMSKGLSTLKEFGVPVDSLSASSLSGALLNAAKSPADALSWAQGLPLPGAVKGALDTVARDAAFAVNLSDTKLSDAMTQTAPGEPVQDTVDRQTVDAASSRVVGDEKIPAVSYSNAVPAVSSAEIEEAFNQAADTFGAIADKFKALSQPLINTKDPNLIAEGIVQISYLIGDLEVLDATMQGLIRRAENLEPPDTSLAARIEKARTFVARLIKAYEGAIDTLKRRGVEAVNQ